MLIYPEGDAIKAVYEDGERHLIHYTSTALTAGKSVTFESAPGPGPVFRLSYSLTAPDTLSVTFGMVTAGQPNFRPHRQRDPHKALRQVVSLAGRFAILSQHTSWNGESMASVLGFLDSIPRGRAAHRASRHRDCPRLRRPTLWHRAFQERDFVDHNEVGGIIIAVSGTIYAVILGFLTVEAWEHYREAGDLVVLDADADIDAWHTSVGLPQATQMRGSERYGQLRHDNDRPEWPKMKTGRFDIGAAMISMDAIDATVNSRRPKPSRNQRGSKRRCSN